MLKLFQTGSVSCSLDKKAGKERAMFFSIEGDCVCLASTDQIFNQIKSAPNEFLEKKLDGIKTIQFKDYLQQMMKKYHCTARQLIIRSCLSKAFAYQIMNGERMPGRDVVLRISLSLKATEDETQRLLALAGKGALYPRVRRDAAILCCIETHRTLEDTDLFLREHGEKALL